MPRIDPTNVGYVNRRVSTIMPEGVLPPRQLPITLLAAQKVQ
jgi:hypothetical protein